MVYKGISVPFSATNLTAISLGYTVVVVLVAAAAVIANVAV